MRRQLSVVSCQIVFLAVLFCWVTGASAADPWGALRDQFKSQKRVPVITSPPAAPVAKVKTAPVPIIDPWAQLQAIFVPFTPEEEETAQVDPVVRKKIATKLNRSLAPYAELISEASARFNVPTEMIAAVIMVESSGNPRAAARTSSAKGLMQTIDATFAEARAALRAQGLYLRNNPFDPHASIMAGTWYLDKMFRQVVRDRGPVLDRNSLTSWRLPTEYYYAGPGHGRKRSQVVMIYAGGRKIRVDKSGYSNKVLRWARILG